MANHRWCEADNIAALYVYRFGAERLGTTSAKSLPGRAIHTTEELAKSVFSKAAVPAENLFRLVRPVLESTFAVKSLKVFHAHPEAAGLDVT